MCDVLISGKETCMFSVETSFTFRKHWSSLNGVWSRARSTVFYRIGDGAVVLKYRKNAWTLIHRRQDRTNSNSLIMIAGKLQERVAISGWMVACYPMSSCGLAYLICADMIAWRCEKSSSPLLLGVRTNASFTANCVAAVGGKKLCSLGLVCVVLVARLRYKKAIARVRLASLKADNGSIQDAWRIKLVLWLRALYMFFNPLKLVIARLQLFFLFFFSNAAKSPKAMKF